MIVLLCLKRESGWGNYQIRVVGATVETVNQKNRGFTLVEVLVAIVILFISMMAVLHALGLSVEHNMKNIIMDEAVRI